MHRDYARDRPTVKQVKPILEAFRKMTGNSCGGALHVVLEGPNYSDADVRWCVDFAMDRGDQAAVFVGYIMLMMSPTQRRLL